VKVESRFERQLVVAFPFLSARFLMLFFMSFMKSVTKALCGAQTKLFLRDRLVLLPFSSTFPGLQAESPFSFPHIFSRRVPQCR